LHVDSFELIEESRLQVVPARHRNALFPIPDPESTMIF
jgi:hypothetical protein